MLVALDVSDLDDRCDHTVCHTLHANDMLCVQDFLARYDYATARYVPLIDPTLILLYVVLSFYL